jgi:hypothetical protein
MREQVSRTREKIFCFVQGDACGSVEVGGSDQYTHTHTHTHTITLSERPRYSFFGKKLKKLFRSPATRLLRQLLHSVRSTLNAV